jgi:Flp pilus assembly protein TadG
MKARAFLNHLKQNISGAVLVEFALAAPLLMIAGMYCLEIANYSMTVQRVRALTIMVADNAARMGANSSLTNKQITESEINDLLLGADQQSGNLNIKTNGKIILSSLERNASNGQWLHWQRCYGNKVYASTHGVQGDGSTGTSFPGMGTGTPKVQAPAGAAVMFVEVAYSFKPMISETWLPSKTMTDTAALLIRERRDLSQVYNSAGATVSTC